jgi:hypothetical protein
MTEKPFWISRIEKAWEEASIVWLSGVSAIWPGCDNSPTAPKENMQPMMAAARKYGKLG